MKRKQNCKIWDADDFCSKKYWNYFFANCDKFYNSILKKKKKSCYILVEFDE